MNKILCYIYEEMADFEISLLLHCLKQNGKREVVTISEKMEPVMAQSGLKYIPDLKISLISNFDEYEALIIPGGPINNEQNEICTVINEMDQKGKLVSAICFAPQFLGRAGLLNKYKFTTSCSSRKIEELGVEDPYNRNNYIEERVVKDRNIITAQGFAFVDFAEAICEYLNILTSKEEKYNKFGKIKE